MKHVGRIGCVLAVLALAGCDDPKWQKAALAPDEVEQRAYAPKPERAETLHVSGETITCDDILMESLDQNVPGGTFKDRLTAVARETTLEQFMEVTRPYMRLRLNNNISNVVLYKKAKRELGDKADEALDKMVDKEWRLFVIDHEGSDVLADEALKKMGMNRTTFREQRKRSILALYSLKMSNDRPITYNELVTCYDQMKNDSFATPPSVQFRLIDIQPDKVQVTDANAGAVSKARALADELAGRIRIGADFAILAGEYSHGLRREAGGLWPPRDPNSFAPPYDGLARKAMEMEVGEVAGPVEIPGHFFILKLEHKQVRGYRPLAEVQSQVEHKILEDRHNESLRQIETEIAAQTALVDTNTFLDRCLEHVYKQARGQTGGH